MNENGKEWNIKTVFELLDWLFKSLERPPDEDERELAFFFSEDEYLRAVQFFKRLKAKPTSKTVKRTLHYYTDYNGVKMLAFVETKVREITAA